ncbi:MAG: LytR/AlgR family response regulator transcription factor [Flavipsychrobacter sp.]
MMRCIIVEDELQSRTALNTALQKHVDKVKVITEANSVATAVQAINDYRPDLVFLDIQLGDGSGFDVIEQTQGHSFKIIFLTAYNQYAIEAFRVAAIDYLLKPLNKEHLAEAINKALSKETSNYAQQATALMQYFRAPEPTVSFSTTEGYSIYHVSEIIRCESDSNYCRIFFTNGSSLYVSKTLKDIEEQLSKYGFERIHQSYLISMKHLKKYYNKDGGYVLMSDGSQLPVSQRKRAHLMSLLEQVQI